MPVPRNIITDDGIELFDIPDGVTEEQVKERLAQIRAERNSGLPENSAIKRAEKRLLDPMQNVKETAVASGVSQIMNFQSAPKRAAEGVLDIPIGAFQLGANIPGAITGDPGQLEFADMVNQVTADRNQEIDDRRAARGEMGPNMARGVGNVIAGLGMGPQQLSQSLPGQMTQGAIYGSAGATMLPTEVEDDYWDETAVDALMGAGLGTSIPLAQRGWSMAREFLPGNSEYRQSRQLASAAGDKYDEIVEELSNPVPGETAAQTATPAGSTTFSALETRARTFAPDDFDSIYQQQADANVDLINSIGRQNPGMTLSDDIAAATTARAQSSGGNYRAAFDMPMQPTPALDEILSSPLLTPQIRNSATRLAQADGIMVGDTVTPDNLTAMLHYTKLAIDDALSGAAGPGQTALGANEKRMLGELKDSLVAEMRLGNPMYGRAMDRHAEMSIPIDQMTIAQALDEKLTPALDDFTEDALVARPGSFAQGVRQGQNTVRQATGTDRTLEDVMGPEMAKIEQVGSNVARDQRMTNLARQGAPEINRQIGDIGSYPRVGLLERSMVVINSILSKTGTTRRLQTMRDLAQTMQDPETTRRIMQLANPEEREFLERLAGVLPMLNQQLQTDAYGELSLALE